MCCGVCCLAGGRKPANVKFGTSKNRKIPDDVPASTTLPVNHYVDVHVTGNELIGVESDEPLLVLCISDGDNDDDDCTIEFEVVEPFQPKSKIQAFTPIMEEGSHTARTPVWLLVDVDLLKSDKLNVDEISVSDSQIVEAESVEVLGVNYTAIRLLLSRGFHVVSAVTHGGDITPQLDLFQYIYVQEVRRGHTHPCVAAQRPCGGGPTPPDLSAADDETRSTVNRPLIYFHSFDDLVSPRPSEPSATGLGRLLAADVPTAGSGVGDRTPGIIPSPPGRIDADERSRTNRPTTTSGDETNQNNGWVTVNSRQGVDGDETATERNHSSSVASAPASVDVPYVVHPMIFGHRPVESYVVKFGNAADELAANGPHGPPAWRPVDHDHSSSSEQPVSPTVIAVLTSLAVAIFFVIVCILGFVVSELVCGQSGYGRARLLGKHGARVSPYYVD